MCVVDPVFLIYCFVDPCFDILLFDIWFDVLLLILRPDRQDFQGTAVTVDVANKLGVPNLFLIVNKVPSGISAADLEAQMLEAYGEKTAAVLPLSEEVVQNASKGLFSLTSPDNAWSAQIRRIAETVKGVN